MASTTFTDHVTSINTPWLNDVNSLVWGVFSGATTAALARTALGLGTIATINSPVPIANGGTASTTAAGAITALGAVDISTTQNIAGTKHFTGTDTLVDGLLSALGGLQTASGTSIASTGAITTSALLTTSGQVKFPSTQNPSANANTLDDYAEGTFTPSITFGGNAVGATYSAQLGIYTKIGNTVNATFNVVLSAKGSSTGVALIIGLPFTSRTVSGFFVIPHLYYNGLDSGVATTPTGFLRSNSTSIDLYRFINGSVAALSDPSFTDTSDIRGSITYYV